MQIEDTPIDGLTILTPRRFGDDRGFFCELWNAQRMADAGLHYDFVQDNHSLSMKRGTLRGLHFQAPPHGQAKLVRCGRGALWDVAVDVRAGSPTYGHWYGLELSFDNGKQLMIPEGFLHGFVTLQDDTEVVYKCTGFYAAEADGAVAWDSCGIDWPIYGEPVISAKDAAATPLSAFETPFKWEPAP